VPTPLAKLLAAQIAASGPITFAEFMRACLYHAEHGYYSRLDALRAADYFTSVDAHHIFGRLLARQLVEMWREMGAPDEFWLVECGAGTGRLAAQILDFALLRRGDFGGAAWRARRGACPAYRGGAREIVGGIASGDSGGRDFLE
jgi:SAM-dependent MidA family methyltransferase